MDKKRFGFIGIMCLVTVFATGILNATSANAAPKTLKIGVVSWVGWPLGLDFVDGVKILAAETNKKGGLDVGGEKYRIEIIEHDSKMKQSVAKGAVERLVYQDKVKFILGDETVDAWLPITEENKVLVCAVTPAPAIMNPEYKYCYQGAAVTNQTETLLGWLSKNKPNLKSIISTVPDHKMGHIMAEKVGRIAKVFGLRMMDPIVYPPTQKDFSAIGTKIKSLNPDILSPNVGGAPRDAAIMKAAYEAGYRGQVFCAHGLTAGHILHFTSPETVEGLLGGMNDVEMDDPPPVAKAYKTAYIAKHGKWTDPDVLFLTNWYLMIAGIQKAGSVDPEKVKAVMDQGIRFTSASGEVMSVARPDMGNKRACDIVVAFNVKKIVGGKIQKVAYIPVEEAIEINKKFTAR